MKLEILIHSIKQWHKGSGIQHDWKSNSPYQAWVVETILQQTRIAQGGAYIQRFLQRFPDVSSLAKAAVDDVLRVWEGLGYYRRAHLMHKAAQMVEEKGQWPETKEEWLILPGIGPYSAGALASFVNNENCPAIDGNVIRVFSRWYDLDIDLYSARGKRHLHSLVESHLTHCHANKYNQILMDFGSNVCKPKTPLCSACVAQAYCKSFKEQTIENRPIKKIKRPKTHRYFILYWHVNDCQQLGMVKREAKDIWQGLWTLPHQETAMAHWASIKEESNVLTHRQTLSHQYINTAVLQEEAPTSVSADIHYIDLLEAVLLPMDRSSRQYVDRLAKDCVLRSRL
ncbi:MAG TPA: A/G-specific adenine glycosylase [Bacteroidetes bacterium]|nr:A/G-specific adenine glycosylase [Bacteroidota bacterium]|tara:strand:- start:3095 stop:4117 length:1023 start_codon:yes stop_codon:yes gene_type:complete